MGSSFSCSWSAVSVKENKRITYRWCLGLLLDLFVQLHELLVELLLLWDESVVVLEHLLELPQPQFERTAELVE